MAGRGVGFGWVGLVIDRAPGIRRDPDGVPVFDDENEQANAVTMMGDRWDGQACVNDRPTNVLYHNILSCQVKYLRACVHTNATMLIRARRDLLDGLGDLEY